MKPKKCLITDCTYTKPINLWQYNMLLCVCVYEKCCYIPFLSTRKHRQKTDVSCCDSRWKKKTRCKCADIVWCCIACMVRVPCIIMRFKKKHLTFANQDIFTSKHSKKILAVFNCTNLPITLSCVCFPPQNPTWIKKLELLDRNIWHFKMLGDEVSTAVMATSA